MQLLFPFAQRWDRRREFIRKARDGGFLPGEFGAEPLAEAEARRFVIEHHYAASFPAAHCAIGLFRKAGVAPAALVGVAVFSEGIQSHRAMPRYTGFDRAAGTELGRLVLAPEVAFNGETWFIRRAFDALRQAKPDVRVCLSYADPVARTTSTGQVVKPGHFGSIYQASNALHLGRAEGRTLYLRPDGTVLQGYTFNKLLNRRKGWAGAQRQIEAAIGPQLPGEDEAAWCARAKATLRPLKHPGNLVYAFGLDAAAWKQIRALNDNGQPYPKARDFAAAA